MVQLRAGASKHRRLCSKKWPQFQGACCCQSLTARNKVLSQWLFSHRSLISWATTESAKKWKFCVLNLQAKSAEVQSKVKSCALLRLKMVQRGKWQSPWTCHRNLEIKCFAVALVFAFAFVFVFVFVFALAFVFEAYWVVQQGLVWRCPLPGAGCNGPVPRGSLGDVTVVPPGHTLCSYADINWSRFAETYLVIGIVIGFGLVIICGLSQLVKIWSDN